MTTSTFAKKSSLRISLAVAIIALWLAQMYALAQTPVVLRLRGVGIGDDASYGSDIHVTGNHVYLAWPGGLDIFNVINPFTPVRVGSYASREQVNAVRVAGRHAYLATGTASTLTNDPGALEIIDVIDPSSPTLLGRIETLGRANSLRVQGNYAYVAESTRWTGSNLLGALEIFDVSTPTNPIRLATFDTAGSATSVDISDRYAWLADGVTDLQVLDLNDPSHPQRVGVFISDVLHNGCGFEAGGPANYVELAGGLAYSAGDNGLHILNISNPSAPVSIGDNFCFPVQSLHVSGHHVYATTWVSHANTYYLSVLDASDPANLIRVGSSFRWGSPIFQAVGSFVYVANGPLLVYEITDRPAVTSLQVTPELLYLEWDFAPGFRLQRSLSLDNPVWSDIPDSENRTSIQLPMTTGNEFFRLEHALNEFKPTRPDHP